MPITRAQAGKQTKNAPKTKVKPVKRRTRKS
jgi:hypothetical protein